MFHSKDNFKIGLILFLTLLIHLNQCQPYQINLDYPFLLTNQNLNIEFVNMDFNGYFYAIFTDGSVRKYHPDLSSYISLIYSKPIQSVWFSRYIIGSIQQGNGSTFTSNTSIQLVLSNNSKTYGFYNSYSFQFLDGNSMDDQMVENFVFGVQYPNSIIVSIGYFTCTNNLYVLYKSQKYVALNFTSIFGTNVTAIGGYHKSPSLTNLNNCSNFNLGPYIILSNKNVLVVSLSINLKFNFVTNSFDYNGFNITYTVVVNLSEPVNNVQRTSNYNGVIMQNHASMNYSFYGFGSSYGINSTNLTPYQMIQLLDTTYGTYMLTNMGLILLKLRSSKLTFSSMINLPTNNNYLIKQGNSFDAFYIKGGPFIYKSGQCVGQTMASSTLCVAYNCSDPNCLSCPINNITCGTCSNGYIRNQNFICVPNTSVSINFTFTLGFLEEILLYLLRILEAIISIPGARALITPFFYLFGNFDDLYLYQFHDRKYNSVVNDFFNQLNNLETKKWNLVNSTQIVSLFMNVEAFNNFTNFQQQYQIFNYTDNTINANQSQGLLANSSSYFVSTVPIVIVYFCLFHFIFLILFRYFYSKLVRKFYFWGFLSILLFEGNIQQLCFYIIRQWNSIFAFKFNEKLFKISIIFFGFAVIFISASLPYLARYFYKLKVSIIIEKTKRNMLGLFAITVKFGLRNIGLSFLHFYGRMLNYQIFMGCLVGSQLFFLIVIPVLISVKAFTKCLEMWIFFMLSLLRLIFIVTFMIDYQNLNEQLLYCCQFNLILLMILIFAIGIIIQSTKIGFELKNFIQTKIACRSPHAQNKNLAQQYAKAQKSKYQQQDKTQPQIINTRINQIYKLQKLGQKCVQIQLGQKCAEINLGEKCVEII